MLSISSFNALILSDPEIAKKQVPLWEKEKASLPPRQAQPPSLLRSLNLYYMHSSPQLHLD